MSFVIEYSTRFIRTFRKLEPALQEEIVEKVELLKDETNHGRLRVHKLSGKLTGVWSFSVNYRICVTFARPKKNVIVLAAVGTHDEVY